MGAGPVDEAAAVRVQAAAYERAGGQANEVELPRLEFDGRSCFLPVPCWGRRHARCEQWTETTVVAPSSASTVATRLCGNARSSSATVLETTRGYFESSEMRRRWVRPASEMQPSPR